MFTGPAGRLSGGVTMRMRWSVLSPWVVKGICGPWAGTIQTFAKAGSMASLNHSFSSLGALSSTARAAGSDRTRREWAAAPDIAKPYPSGMRHPFRGLIAGFIRWLLGLAALFWWRFR